MSGKRSDILAIANGFRNADVPGGVQRQLRN